jgi:prefoldin subunit 5
MLNKIELNVIPEDERDKALEHYMKRCFQLEQEIILLREEIKRLRWSIEEHD